MKKITFLFALFLASSVALFAQVDARLLRYPDVSETQITFVYAGDIWVVAKEGGTAFKLSSPKGEESFPRFSPDGKQIAFSGNYDGNTDLYIIPVMGGIPERITSHDFSDRLLDWTPDGKNLLYASSMYSGRQRYSQFYTVPVKGGLSTQLPIPYGEFASLSKDGDMAAYTKRSRVFRTWKRYRGGMAANITLFNLKTLESSDITNTEANDELPMWQGNKIYFLSDNGKENRFNIWVYDLDSKESKQLTSFADYDIHFPSIGPKEIVFEAGGALYLLDLTTNKYNQVNINVVTDQITLAPKSEEVSGLVQNGGPSPDGKRAVIEARGELFSVPAEFGPVLNLSNSCGSAERYPAWSPNGKFIAYWSDKTGEYQLTLLNTEDNSVKTLTSFENGFRYKIYWSPDNKKLAFIDQSMTINYYDIDENKVVKVDQGLYMFEGALQNFTASWSSDSRWIAYSRDLATQKQAVFIFDTKEKTPHQVTSGFYSDANPSFDPDGKYLFFTTNRDLNPVYSDLDNTFIYPNTTQLAAVSLRKDVPSPTAPKNDSVEIKKDEPKDKDKDKKDEKDKDKKKDEEKDKSVKIDFDGFENRVVILPPKAGNLGEVQSVTGKVIFHRFPNSGSADKQKPIMYYDLTERKEETVVDDADAYMITADGKKALVYKSGSMAFVDIKPGQKMDKSLRLKEMVMTVNPKEEWKQIFNDVWRLERDYFYDPNMHGVDWNFMRKHYGKLLDYAVTRTDVNFIIGELIAELSASHTYRGGGDEERAERKNVGYLGIDWGIEKDQYKIAKIITDASWDVESRSPLSLPGVNANIGDYILAVNGTKLNVNKDPYLAFQGLAGKTVELTLKDAKADTIKKVLVELMDSEDRLRHLAWIENNRKYVEDATGGKIGYIYVPSTGTDGQTELIRQFTAQLDKQGLIIDERFNSGGQIPDRFVEMLNRKPLAFWAVRDGHTWQWPPSAVFGPKVMLINGWSGSGGDAFPDYFRKYKLGPLVGTRTWGGLIGISGAPGLIDGGGVTVPTFRMYDPEGNWFKEGHGVDPDIEVNDDPTMLAKGKDAQLDKAIQVVLDELKNNPPPKPKQPKYEKR